MVALKHPVTGIEVARVLIEVSQGYAILDDKRRATAFENAADSLKGWAGTKDVAGMSMSELQKIPLVGKGTAQSIKEITTTGTCERLKHIRAKGVPSLAELLRIEGVGPATAKSLWLNFNITRIEELMEALENGSIDSPGLLNRVKRALANADRIPREALEAVLFPLVEQLRSLSFVDQVMVCGSIRRKREMVKDADVVVAIQPTSENVEALTGACEKIFGEIKSGGERKLQASVRVGDGDRNVDVLITEPSSFGAAVNHFTGSKEHNIYLRTVAKDQGVKINEYGYWRGEERIGGETEEELFEILSLPYLEPEFRKGPPY